MGSIDFINTTQTKFEVEPGASGRKVWFITGTSSGLGRELALSALAAGDRVLATARSLAQIENLKAQYPESCHIMSLDVTAEVSEIKLTAINALKVWGQVDVVVNNAGIGIIAPFEVLGNDGALQHMKVNYLGPINITNAFLPHMRHRREGTVVFIGSRSAWRTSIPLSGAYSASKAALNAAAESIAMELAPFNIRVLNILPGGMRTPMLSTSWRISPKPSESGSTISEYNRMRTFALNGLQAAAGNEPSDPVKTAKVVVNLVKGVLSVRDMNGEGKPHWPAMVALGNDVESDIREKCQNAIVRLEGIELAER